MKRSDSAHESGDLVAGICLAGAAAGTVAAMAYHPSSAHGIDGAVDFVHAGMIVLLAVLFFGFSHFAVRRGIDKPGILAGLVAYGISLAAHIGAATLNGFVVPALAARGADAVSHDIFVLAWEANQALARLGVVATGIAFALWGIDFLTRTGRLNRAIGLAGLVAGVAPAMLLLAGGVAMTVSTAFAIYSVHAVWSVLVGVQLIRRRI